MTTKKNYLKLLFTGIVGLVSICLASVGLLSFKHTTNAKADFIGDNKELTITNQNFTNEKNASTYPAKPDSFTAYYGNEKVENDSSIKANVSAGTIDLTDGEFKNKFPNATQAVDDYVLMIDSTKEVDGETIKYNTNYGFRTNNTINIEANSNYIITVSVYTLQNAKIANLYLFNEDGTVFSSIKGINSNCDWNTYSFYISTNNITSTKLTLGMYLEGAGTVLFDNISAYKYNNQTYQSKLDQADVDKSVSISKEENVVSVFNPNNYTLSLDKHENNGTSSIDTVYNPDGTNEQAYQLVNSKKTYAEFTTEDNFLTFEQNSVYKVSLNVKSTEIDGSATIKLVRTDDEDDSTATLKISAKTGKSENLTYDYDTYSFYVVSHPQKSVDYKMLVNFGTSEETASGKLFINTIEVSKVTYSDYNNAKTDDTLQKIDLSKNFAYNNTSNYLNNGKFDAIQVEDYLGKTPVKATDWTATTGTNTQYHGVINTSDELFNKLSIKNEIIRPDNSNNNVLLMYNTTADTLTYTSATKSLTEKTYHKFELKVVTHSATVNAKLVATINDKKVTLTSLPVSTNGNWQNITLYIHAGYQPIDVALEVTLETKANGYAFIDDAKFDYVLTATEAEQEFNAAANTEFVSKVDLFNILSTSSNDRYSEASFFNFDTNANVQTGIVNINSSELEYDIIHDAAYIENFKALNSEDGNVLAIRAYNDVNFKATSKLGYKLTSGKKYSITLSVYTQLIGSNNEEIELKDLGANVKLSAFDGQFANIKSENHWTEYTFYICPSSDTTTYLEFSIGNENIMSKGSLFVGNITFNEDLTLSDDEFKALKDSDTVKVLETVVTPEEDNTEEETTTDTPDMSSAIWYYIPSIIFAVAIIIAIVGIIMRKVKFKKPVKKTKNAYDRNRTVSKQVYMRKATTARENKLAELNKELASITEQRSQYEEEYKKDLSKLREMKIKRASATEIAKLEREMKKNQRLSASIGVNVNRIQNEIDYVKTDAYLNSLMKKLEREGSAPQADNNK